MTTQHTPRMILKMGDGYCIERAHEYETAAERDDLRAALAKATQS